MSGYYYITGKTPRDGGIRRCRLLLKRSVLAPVCLLTMSVYGTSSSLQTIILSKILGDRNPCCKCQHFDPAKLKCSTYGRGWYANGCKCGVIQQWTASVLHVCCDCSQCIVGIIHVQVNVHVHTCSCCIQHQSSGLLCIKDAFTMCVFHIVCALYSMVGTYSPTPGSVTCSNCDVGQVCR